MQIQIQIRVALVSVDSFFSAPQVTYFSVKCTGYSTSLPYILEAYLVIDGSDKQHGAAYQTLLNELFTKITKDYPGSKLGLGSYIDKPFG